MRSLFVCFLFSFLPFWVNAQPAKKTPPPQFLRGPVQVEDLMKIKPIAIGQLDPTQDTVNTVLPMPFSQAVFSDYSKLKKLPPTDRVFAVYLFYTRYREVDSFSQPKLNEARFNELKRYYPQIFNTEKIFWGVIEQTTAKTKTDAGKVFHGFVIYLKSEELLGEIEKDKKTIDYIVNSYSDTSIYIPEVKTFKVKKKKEGTGKFIPRSKSKREAGILYTKRSIWNREEKTLTRLDTKYTIKSKAHWEKRTRFDSNLLGKAKEFKMLTSKKWSPKTTVVMDVTGSMGPYMAQVLLWMKHSPEIPKQGRFIFFNDGDNMPDELKKTGSTGGLYAVTSQSFDSVKSVMTRAMSNGQGGDGPENDIEALMEAQKKWPETDTLLLIADNEAPVKDLSLLKNIKKPVTVMICGATISTNPHLFMIAKETGGRLMIGNAIINNLKSFKNGDLVTLDGDQWKFKDSVFLKISGTAN